MCDLAEGSVTFTGPFGALLELEHVWETLRTADELRLRRPELQTYAELDSEYHFDDPAAPAQARLFHHWGRGAPVAERLQVELLTRRLPILVEPEHYIGIAAGGVPTAGNPRPTVTIDHQVLTSASTDVVAGSVSGNRVAVVDSGDLLGKPKMYDFTGAFAREDTADDVVGHGTAVSELIRSLKPSADVTALRAVNAQSGTSYELLCALTYALWSGKFDVVNVSLSAQSTDKCMTVLGGSLTMVLDICQNSGHAIPTVVAAAGNSSTGQAFGYPARLPGSTVVQAWDFNGSPASYNVAVPSTHVPVNATGGDSNNTFGTITDTAGNADPMFGTSYATAVATAFLIP
jgi:Subtilase family